MTKKEFIEKLAKQMACPATEAEKHFDQCIQALENLFKADEDLTIPGFGRFYVHKRPARMGRDPKRNIKMQIAAKSVPMFKAGDALKLHVNSWLKQE
jgi:DNA-binding protein HU-beta